jgi:hypothetical protein
VRLLICDDAKQFKLVTASAAEAMRLSDAFDKLFSTG